MNTKVTLNSPSTNPLKRATSDIPAQPTTTTTITTATTTTTKELTRPRPNISHSAPHLQPPNTLSGNHTFSTSPSENSSKAQARFCSPSRSSTTAEMSATAAKDLDRSQRDPLVSNPSDPSRAQKEAAIRSKLRTYEALLAVKEGYMPSTEQATAWARYALRASGVLDSRNRRLSVQGRGFVRDLRAWVEAVVEVGLSKNSDDKIQEFIWHTSNAQIDIRGPGMKGAGGAVAGAKPSGKDVKKIYSKMRLLGSLLYSSPEFRKLLGDVTIVSRDIFADAASFAANVASSAAEKARPGGDISQIEQPAESALGDPNASLDIPSASRIRSMAKDKGISYVEVLRGQTSQSRYDVESYLREKFPKQRRDAVINRLKGTINEIQKNSDFNDTVDFLIEMTHKYIDKMTDNLVKETSTQEPTIRTDEHFDRAVQEMKAILMVFADGKPLDDIHSAAKKVTQDVQSDEDLRSFYSDISNFLTRALKQKDFVISDAADAEAHALYDRSTALLQEKRDAYQPDMQALFQEITSFLDAISQDRENRRVIETSKKVFNDLVILDSQGNFRGFKRRVVHDILDVLLPRLVGEVRYVPIPRVEYQDRDYDLILENLILESDHFIPYKTLFEAITRAEFVNEYVFSSHYYGTSKLRVQGITMFAKDMAFIVRKKTGLIKFEDHGFLDLYLDGRGADAEIILESHSDDDDDGADSVYGSGRYFQVKSVKVNIHNFRYKYNAYHTWAAALLSPIVRPMVRKLVASILEQRIKHTFEMADREIRGVVERMRVASIATSGGGGSFEGWLKAILSRPPGHRGGGAEGRSARVGGGGYKVNIGEDEIFPGEFPPGGVVGKIKDSTERVAALGEEGGWKNDVFDLRA